MKNGVFSNYKILRLIHTRNLLKRFLPLLENLLAMRKYLNSVTERYPSAWGNLYGEVTVSLSSPLAIPSMTI